MAMCLDYVWKCMDINLAHVSHLKLLNIQKFNCFYKFASMILWKVIVLDTWYHVLWTLSLNSELFWLCSLIRLHFKKNLCYENRLHRTYIILYIGFLLCFSFLTLTLCLFSPQWRQNEKFIWTKSNTNGFYLILCERSGKKRYKHYLLIFNLILTLTFIIFLYKLSSETCAIYELILYLTYSALFEVQSFYSVAQNQSTPLLPLCAITQVPQCI